MTLDLVKDYFKRVKIRQKAIQILYKEKDYADVVREVQESVELGLKGILLFYGINYPKSHDIGKIFKDNIKKFDSEIKKHVDKISYISKSLRKDRELAFYGDFDILPLEYYTKEDADDALEKLKFIMNILEIVSKFFDKKL